ncbi:MAG: FAD-dependent oxidoreductase [Chloroflexota bacterium]
MKKRVVIAGLGDTGLLIAVSLSKEFDVVGITPKPGMVSGQDVGGRLAWSESWKKSNLIYFHQYKRLDNVRIVRGFVTSINAEKSLVTIRLLDGTEYVEPYHVLVISSGVQNGFWRTNNADSFPVIEAKIDSISQQVATAQTVAVIGGGATGVSVANNLAERYQDKSIHLFYGRDHLLPDYHPKVQSQIRTHLLKLNVHLHPNHRAKVPDGFMCDRVTSEPVEWEMGQSSFHADVVIWAVGRVSPNNTFISPDMLDNNGFVRVESTLQVSGYDNVFAVGDIAASDIHRSSARNDGHEIVTHNIRTVLSGTVSKMKKYKPSSYRWGEILGVQKTGLRVFTSNGMSVWFSKRVVNWFLFPIVVRRFIYKGIRTKEQAFALKQKHNDLH